MKEITAEYVRSRLAYDPETGVFVWLHCDAMPRKWNTRWAGTVAGCVAAYGYRLIRIDDRLHKAHRIAWLVTHGEWPSADIDHINGDPSDNRMANLRAVSHAENLRNAAMSSRNTSGRIGVYWHKRCGKWRANIRANGQYIHLGIFTDLADAIEARYAAEIAHGFHKNHGRQK